MKPILWAALAVLGLTGMNCSPTPASAEPRPKAMVSVRAVAPGNVRITVTNITCPGNPDSLFIRTRSPMTDSTHTHRFAPCVSRDSFELLQPAPGQTIRDTVRLWTKRRGLTSDTLKLPWSYTEQDVPPPPPTGNLETTIKVTMALPITGTQMRTDEQYKFCLATQFWDGKWAVGKQASADCKAALVARFAASQRVTNPVAQQIADSEAAYATFELVPG